MKLLSTFSVFLLSLLGDVSAQEIAVRNQLIPLKLKKLQRGDRLPPVSEKKSGLFQLPFKKRLPDTRADEAWQEEQFSGLALAHMERLVSVKQAGEMGELLEEGFESSSFGQEKPDDKMVATMSPDSLVAGLGSLGKLKFKTLSASGLKTVFHVEAIRDGAEYSATWECSWVQNEDSLKLARLQIGKSETVYSKGAWFIDGTEAVIGKNPRFQPQVMRGIEYWAERVTRIGDLSMVGHHGIAVGDVNGDGLEDVYVCDGGSLPNQLYIQQSDGTAREMAAEWGVDWLEDSRGALLVDLDNDGDQDLVVSTIAMIVFAENVGEKGFRIRGGFPGAPYPFSLSAADFDSDGDLDIYTCVYSAGDDALTGKRGFESRSPVPFNDAENGGRNVLLANLGNFQFGDVTAQVGLDVKNTRWSFAAAWEDIDRDGDPDLYVANDFGRNCLYINHKGFFTDVAAEKGVEDMAAGMSVAWGDFNRDGAADIQVGNMFSSAGRRVAFQRKFDAGKKRMARGNSLFSGGEKAFADVSESAGITMGGWAWSSGFADLDNDGWQDIVVANGYLTNTRDDDL